MNYRGPSMIFVCVLIGAFFGFFIFHPLIMIIGHLMLAHRSFDISSLLDIVFSESLRSFSLEMLPWSLSFMIFSAIIGLFYAKQRIGKEEIRRSFQAQSILNKLLSISLEDISLEEMLGLTIENVIFLPWFELESKGGIFLVEEDPDVLVMKAQRGLSDQIQKMCARIPFGKCLCGRAAVSGTVEFADCMDERHDTRYRDMPPHGHYCVPIIFMGKVLGVIVLYIKEGHLRNEREEEFLLAVADVVAGIIRRKQSEKALLESEKRYFELSITDALTGLYNPRHYHNQLKSEIERTARYNRPLSLILMDIDDFKQYNDTYGHPEGDKVLARLGGVIRGCLRKTDSAYRYGGEEFTVILPETEGENATNAGERIRKRFESEVFSPGLGEKGHKTVSIGVAEYWPEEELLTFMKRADKAMYSAKEQGKNRVFFLKWDPDE